MPARPKNHPAVVEILRILRDARRGLRAVGSGAFAEHAQEDILNHWQFSDDELLVVIEALASATDEIEELLALVERHGASISETCLELARDVRFGPKAAEDVS